LKIKTDANLQRASSKAKSRANRALMLPSVSFSTHADDALTTEFCALVTHRLGLLIRPKDRATVAEALNARIAKLKLDGRVFLRLLQSQRADEGEWLVLMPHLTNGESYFERDKGQFALLRETILPELVERRRESGSRTLRVWSAGCSTGEEAYSLALSARAVLPSGWKAHILGTDINFQSLERARRGVYGAWSFRGVESATRERFFRPVANGLEVLPELREGVQFAFCNLGEANWPDAARGLGDFDLIVCRNVLIYFERAVVAGVVERFSRSLREGGVLLTGHAELHDQNLAPLKTRILRESLVFEKVAPAPIAQKNIFPVPMEKPELAGGKSFLSGERNFLAGGNISPARGNNFLAGGIFPPAGEMIPPATETLETAGANLAERSANEWCETARQHADAGRLDEAMECCQKAIEADPMHEGALLLWAHIAEERGERARAKTLLRRVLYLSPSHPEAHLELAAIHENEGDFDRAHRAREQARDLLLVLPEGARLSGGALALDVAREVEALLGPRAGVSPRP